MECCNFFFQRTCHSILEDPCHFGRGILYVFYINCLVSIVQRPSLKWFYCLKDVLCVNKQKNLYLNFWDSLLIIITSHSSQLDSQMPGYLLHCIYLLHLIPFFHCFTHSKECRSLRNCSCTQMVTRVVFCGINMRYKSINL